MRTINIDFTHDDIESVTADKKRNLIIVLKSGDSITLKAGNERTKKLKRHLLKQFSGDHID